MKKFENRKILIADKIHPSGISILRKNKFDIYPNYNLSNSDLIKIASKLNTEILIVRSIRKLDKQFISRLRNETSVKVLCTASSGMDNIDVSYAKKSGFSVFNVPDGNFVSAAEHTFTLILAAVKNLTKYDASMKKGIFDNSKSGNFELSGKVIGVIGVGRVGSYVARLANAFNMRVLGNDIKKNLKYKYKWIEFVGLKHLLQPSDVVTVHVSLNDSTANLLGKMDLQRLRKNSIFINCSRGGIVDEKALLEALKRKKISYAGLDVFQNEPGINKAFAKLNNVILTPHVAGKTKESIERISVLLAKAIVNYVKP